MLYYYVMRQSENPKPEILLKCAIASTGIASTDIASTGYYMKVSSILTVKWIEMVRGEMGNKEERQRGK